MFLGPACPSPPQRGRAFNSAPCIGRRAIASPDRIGHWSAGLLQLKESGAHTIAQSERSCVVFGMPAAAIGFGASCEVADLEDIPAAIVAALPRRVSA